MYFQVPPGEKRKERLADLLNAAEQVAIRGGFDFLGFDVPSKRSGKPRNKYVAEVCGSLGWPLVHFRRDHRKHMAKMGLYVKRAPKSRIKKAAA